MEPQNHKIQTLIDQYVREELMLPAMQRKYVWKQTQVRDLIDSIYRGYPSGSILIWETEIIPKTRDASLKTNQDNAMTRRLMLLDGQQRITSLAAVITGIPIRIKENGEVREKIIELYFNIDHPDIEKSSEENDELFFQVKSKKIQNNQSWISVTKLFKEGVGSTLKDLKVGYDHPKYDIYNKRLNQLYNSKDNYFYPVQLLRKMDYREVTKVFVRVNSAGTRLRGSDLALAQITSRWDDAIHVFEKYLEETAKYHFYLDDGFLVRCITAIATDQSKFDSLGRIPIEKLQEAWEEAHQGIDHAINFLRDNAGIESTHLFGPKSEIFSPNLMVPLVVYFVKHKAEPLTDEVARKFLYWFFYAHAWGRYSSSTETKLDQDIKAISESDPVGALIRNVYQQVTQRSITPEDLALSGQNSSLFLLSYLVAKSSNATDWFTGTALNTKNIGIHHKIEIHHIFPRARIEKLYSKEMVNEIANFAFLSKKANLKISDRFPNVYLAKIDPERLAAQSVPIDKGLWEIESFEAFLSERRRLLAEGMNRFLGSFMDK